MEIVKRALSLTPKIEVHNNAVVVPIQNLRNGEFQAGVMTSEGEFCEQSVHIKAGLKCLPPNKGFTVNKKIDGKHLYCGMLQNSHFGHFMVESISRLWASSMLKHVDTLVFYKREKRKRVPKFVEEFVELLSDKIPITIVEEPTVFETLFVPNQLGIEKSGAFIHHSATASCISQLLEKVNRTMEGMSFPDKVYVSRSKLSGREGGFVGEKQVEKNLERQGYRTIHPETMSVLEQLQYYVSAKKIIFSDGSAYHLFAIVAQTTQDVFVIWRRKKHFDFDFQLISKTGELSKGKPHLKGYWKTAGLPVVSSTQIAKLDHDKLHESLVRNNFIDTSSNWDAPSEEAIAKEVEAISTYRKVELEYEVYPVS